MRKLQFRAWDGESMEEPAHFQELVDYIEGMICRCGERTLGQFTGLTDKNGVDIYEGYLINVFFTSNDGEHIHDCIYEVRKGTLGGIELKFKSLLWESYGWNQHTLSSTLSESTTRISEDYQNRGRLLLNDSWGENHTYRERWKEIDESRYFEIIGNIHQNPELLNNQQPTEE